MSDLPPPPPPPPPPPGGGFVPAPPGGYATAGAGYAAPRTDGLAIASLVIGIIGLVCSFGCLGIVLGPTAAIMGFISRQRIPSSVGFFSLYLSEAIHSATTSSPSP